MNWRKIVSLVLGLMGLIYFAQGSGIFTVYPSVMNNDVRWAVVGVALLAVALLLWPRATQKK